jgi:PAS domain S-box-containing protein
MFGMDEGARHLEDVEERLRREPARCAHEMTELVRLRQAAEEAEERFRVALGAAELGTWDFDPRTGAFSCDARFKDLFGVPHEAELTPDLVMRGLHPDDRPRLLAVTAQAIEVPGGGSMALACRVIGIHDRVERWISLRGRPFLGQGGKPTRFTGVALEITEQVRAQEKLREAQHGATSVADAVPQIVWTTDEAGQIDFYNRRWYEYTGLPVGQVSIDDWTKVVHPVDLPLIQQRWSSSLERGLPFQAEVRLLRAADRNYRWHLAQSIPVRDANGRLVRWVGSSTDIEDQKRVEAITRFLSDASALLAESLDSEATLQKLARLVVPHMADWCVIYLVEEDDLSKSKVFLEHVDPKKVLWARELSQRYPPALDAPRGPFHVIRTGKPELYPRIPDALLAEAAKDAEHLRILRAVGMRSVMTVPITARGRTFGAITFVSAESGRCYQQGDVVLAQTLAERTAHAVDNARLYAEAQEAVRVREDFMSIASHELKTPLTPLHLHLQALQRHCPERLPEGVAKRVDVMSRQVDRLERLVRGLIDISRITGRRFEVECEDVDLSATVRDVVDRFAPELEQAHCPLVLDVADSVVGFWDRLRIEQIVSNLLTNAIKFGAGKPIEAQVSAQGDIATLVVRDHGIGIGPEDQARIFERFERAVPSRHYGGFGLGLWIVRQLAGALGGTVSVESKVGTGSAFQVVLPQHRATC